MMMELSRLDKYMVGLGSTLLADGSLHMSSNARVHTLDHVSCGCTFSSMGLIKKTVAFLLAVPSRSRAG